MPGKKALLVISNGKSAKMNGSLATTEEELTKAGVSYVIYNGIGANPLKSQQLKRVQKSEEKTVPIL